MPLSISSLSHASTFADASKWTNMDSFHVFSGIWNFRPTMTTDTVVFHSLNGDFNKGKMKFVATGSVALSKHIVEGNANWLQIAERLA